MIACIAPKSKRSRALYKSDETSLQKQGFQMCKELSKYVKRDLS